MSQQLFLNINGQLVSATEPDLSVSNRAFKYGDALFETMKMAGERILFVEDHINRLKQGMKVLKMDAHPHLSPEYLYEHVLRLLYKRQMSGNVRLRLTVFRNDGGYYAPKSNAVSFAIEAEPLKDSSYAFNKEGCNLLLYEDIKKPINPVSGLKSTNCLPFVLAGLYMNEKKGDDCLILNEKGHIAEALSSNIFLVKDSILYTPPLSDCCVPGIMRVQVMRMASKLKIRVCKQSILPGHLTDADEIFLTNVITGIRWVRAYKGSRYYSGVSKMLFETLQDEYLED